MKRTKTTTRKAKSVAAKKGDWAAGWTEELERDFQEAGPHVYDKAKWHYDGDFPKGLPKKQAFVHTGLFVGWLIRRNMISRDFTDQFTREFRAVAKDFKLRKITGPEAYKIWGGCLDSDMLTVEGNEFARKYYDGSSFANDYWKLLVRDLPSFYHVQNTWTNYELLKRQIDVRYERWKKKRCRSKQGK